MDIVVDEGRHGGWVLSEDPAPPRAARSARSLVLPAIRVAAVVAAVIVVPYIVKPTTLGVFNAIGIATLGAIALNLLLGVAGQVSIGHAGFLAVGAFTAGLLGAEAGLPFPLVLVAAAVVSGLIGAVVGAPAVRVRGLYLVVATLAFHYVVGYAGFRIQQAAVGSLGFLLPIPHIGPISLKTDHSWFYLIWGVSLVSALLVANLVRSRFGRAWFAIRSGEISAESAGINVAGYKLLAFALSSALVGLAGGIFAYYYRSVQIESFNFELAVQYAAMVIIGGLGAISGSYYGAAFVIGLPHVVQMWAREPIEELLGFGSVTYVQSAIYGICIITFLLLEPRGLAHVVKRVRKAGRARLARHVPALGRGART